ncbi:MAG: 23S rRNA (uracil(1939)-C(5))-methyltransferase RlmD [Bacteroidetes bacterium]|nr:23S rRNA (uracil(1939)-C(5))-methyltransferase RlmD [Bacteroidota bacterium]MBU1372864.1 23S rRNA (uracil(1939)-C(5))-methyltransferase RlmD [Bacteroidota bacterium]MBU1485593.1 23S rRNA (uracil(1939)-C(5))-methyltransferase RlmD [Bacteroidota bacterium]MBU1759792.1 23S rRNA (uracil(1939)-C(5))-methyltransferase RlmD [Bacteroidota bacterium]MBU2046817.1 23S rRNA (uracil(1939)-C(5))-methyltransferase RlmD [Bacteroidota bacterium]
MREQKILTALDVFDIAEEGKGVARADDLVIFIEKAIPGDVVDAAVYKKKKKFAEARIETLITPSVDRVVPFCEHFGICGGCKWQHMDYAAQLKYKNKSVLDALQRLAGLETSHAEPILPSAQDKYYRNKLEYTFSNKRWLTDLDGEITDEKERLALGFHVPLRFDKILEINHCYLQADPSNDLRNSISAFAKENDISFYDLRAHEGALRNLVIRTSSTGELMVIVIFAYPEEGQVALMMEFVKAKFSQITSLLYIINQKKNDTFSDQEVLLYSGREFINEEMEGLKFRIGPKSFYQTNSLQAYELYKITRDFADLKGDELVYDLYTGTGTIANFIAKKAKKVVGVEYVPDAIEDAKINSKVNGIDNTVFYAGDMKDILSNDFINQNGKPNVVITDPPRAGMHPDVVERLMELEAEKIVYVSCNAATQARDLIRLKEKYELVRIKPVDMFPHTQHVENVVLLKLKK